MPASKDSSFKAMIKAAVAVGSLCRDRQHHLFFDIVDLGSFAV